MPSSLGEYHSYIVIWDRESRMWWGNALHTAYMFYKCCTLPKLRLIILSLIQFAWSMQDQNRRKRLKTKFKQHYGLIQRTITLVICRNSTIQTTLKVLKGVKNKRWWFMTNLNVTPRTATKNLRNFTRKHRQLDLTLENRFWLILILYKSSIYTDHSKVCGR